jgi:ABC-type transporter Mla subunit MlaD
VSLGPDRERLALEVRRAAKPFAVLLVFLACVIAAASVILGNIGVSMPWQDTYTTRVAIDDAAGVVEKKQAVRLAGIEVGLIQDLSLEDGRAVATIELDPDDGPIYRDARLRLRPETPVDDIYLDIEDRGTPAAGALGEDDILAAERTRTAVDIGRVANVFGADTRVRMEAAIDGYGRALGDQGDEFRNALVQLAPFLEAAEQLTRQTAVRRQQTRRLIHNFRLMTEELAVREQDLRKLVAGGAGSLGELGRSETAVGRTIAELPPTMRRLQSAFTALRAAADELDPAFDALRPVARALPEGLEGLRSFAVAARPAFSALRKPLPALRDLAGALRPTAQDLRTAFDDLGPVPGRLDRVTALIEPCERALSKFFHNTNSLGKFEDENSVILRGQAVVGFNSAGGVANDPNQTAAPSCAPGGPSR